MRRPHVRAAAGRATSATTAVEVVKADVLHRRRQVYAPGDHDATCARARRSARRACAPGSTKRHLPHARAAAPRRAARQATIRVFIKPLIVWLWIGGGDDGRRHAARRRSPAGAGAAPTDPGVGADRRRTAGPSRVDRARSRPAADARPSGCAPVHRPRRRRRARRRCSSCSPASKPATHDVGRDAPDRTSRRPTPIGDAGRRQRRSTSPGARAAGSCSTSSSRPACRAGRSTPSWSRSSTQQAALADGAELYTVVLDDDRDDGRGVLRRERRRLAGRATTTTGSIAVAFGVAKVPETWIIDPDGHRPLPHASPQVTADFLGSQLRAAARGRRRDGGSAPIKRWPAWVLLVLVVVGFLAVGATARRRAEHAESGPRRSSSASPARSATARACSSRATTASENIRTAIAPLVDAGRAQRRRDHRPHRAALRRPRACSCPRPSGFDALVWALPVAALVCAVAGLASTFRRWRREAADDHDPTDDDRELVAAALRAPRRLTSDGRERSMDAGPARRAGGRAAVPAAVAARPRRRARRRRRRRRTTTRRCATATRKRAADVLRAIEAGQGRPARRKRPRRLAVAPLRRSSPSWSSSPSAPVSRRPLVGPAHAGRQITGGVGAATRPRCWPRPGTLLGVDPQRAQDALPAGARCATRRTPRR